VSHKPYLLDRISDIKYIKLERLILPKLYKLRKITEDNSTAIYTAVSTKIVFNVTTDANIASYINTSDTVGSDIVTYVNITYIRDTLFPFNLLSWAIEFIVNGNTLKLYTYEYPTNNYYSYTFNPMYNLMNERYMIISIEEFDKLKNGTSDNVKNSYTISYPDNITDYYVYFHNDNIITRNLTLDKMNSITISIIDSSGNILEPAYVNYDINTPNTCICTNDNINYQCASHYIRHPYYRYNQMTLIFRVGVVETKSI